MEQREALAKAVQQQRDALLKDVKLAAQVQRLFLPAGKPAIDWTRDSRDDAPSWDVGGDYHDYIPVDAHTIQVVIADVAGKGVPAALLMSATAAAMRLEANRDRNMLEQVERLNTEIGAVSDPERYVTLLVAEIDTNKRIINYVNCGHNPALLFRAKTGTLTRLDSSCPPIGLSPDEICELASADLADDVLVFYTDGVTEAANRLGEEFGMERLSTTVRSVSSFSPEELMINIYNAPYGGKQRQVQVDLNTTALQSKGLSALDVVSAISVQNLILPTGTSKIESKEYDVSILNAPPQAINDLNRIPIKTTGRTTIYIKDVA